MAWYDSYIGKPWEAVPRPPESFNCGELLRSVLSDRKGVQYNKIDVDATRLTDCVKAFDPAIFGLRAREDGEERRELDCVFLARGRYEDHCGIAV